MCGLSLHKCRINTNQVKRNNELRLCFFLFSIRLNDSSFFWLFTVIYTMPELNGFWGKKQQISSILKEQIQNENCNYICLNQTKI